MNNRQWVYFALEIVFALMVCSFTGCDTKNIGHQASPWWGLVVSVAVPFDFYDRQEATWTVIWERGTAPYSITVDMGGGTTENIVSEDNVTSPWTHTFTMVGNTQCDSPTYSYTTTVTDARGLTGTATGSYYVPTSQSAPIIDETATSYDEQTQVLTVVATDPDGDSLTATISDVPGLVPDATTKNMSQAVTATFVYNAEDIFAGGSGMTTIIVDDGNGGTDTYDVEIAVDPISIPADTLIATPIRTTLPVNWAVTVVVATGVPANPFQFMNGVGVTVEEDAEYVDNSFNAGVPGGDAGAVDGFWAVMNPGGGFLLPPDNFFQSTDIGGGRERWDFNLTPIAGSDQTTAEGVLFNFEFEFSEVGLKTLGFQDVTADTVKRTYYSDTLTEYFWGDISNDGTVAPNSIEVS